MVLKSSATSPGEPPIYMGIYVDDIIYFSHSNALSSVLNVYFPPMKILTLWAKSPTYLDIEFTWKHHIDGHLSVSLTQQSFAESLLASLGISLDNNSTYTTPYQTGCSIDSIRHHELSSTDRDCLCLQYQSLFGSLNWLAHTTRPDLSTVVSLLAQHESNPSPGHLDATLYATKYLAMTNI
jgi:hypothetical protein